MKKIVCLISIVLITASALACFSACNSNSEPTRIELTTENYADYIAVNVYYSDLIAELSPKSSETFNYYDLTCIGNITTSKRVDAVFENVSIVFYADLGLWRVSALDKPTAQLDHNAVSHCSFPVAWKDSPLLYFPYSQKMNIRIDSIEGFVVIG